MKKLIFLLLIFSSSNLFSQDYFPIVEEYKEWNTLQIGYPGTGNPWDTIYWTKTYKISGDTLIDNILYKKVMFSEEEIPVNYEFFGGIREDENHEVWFYPTVGITEERLIYDYSVNIGDTLENLYQSVMIVDSIAYHEIAGADRKHIYFSYIDFPCTELWIEGIGSNFGILSSGNGCTLGGWTWFLCMTKEGELIYMNPNFNTCYLINTGTNERISNDFVLTPNPAKDILILKNINHYQISSIKLFKVTGTFIKKFNIESTVLDIKDILPGSYLIIVETAEGTYRLKLIVK